MSNTITLPHSEVSARSQNLPASMYLTGGRQKRRKLEEWHAYDKAVVLRYDAAADCVLSVCEYLSPGRACPDSDPSITFKAASIAGRRMYIPTNTEVLVYDIPGFRQVGYYSLPSFNDVHYACPARNGNLFVVSTGLDMVVEVDGDGRAVRELPVLGGDPWAKFKREVDYRKVPTTKPHDAHPNFILECDERIWVTRANRKDAICLDEPARSIEFCGFPHDGVVWGDNVYFTTVNGHIYLVDRNTMTIRECFDLNVIDGRDVSLGWMRAIFPVTESTCWVGFTRLRPTRLKENVSWVKHGFRHYYLPTRIALYDLARKCLVKEVNLEPYGIDAVYSIVAQPE